jgi:hypothetical protein
MSPRSAVPTELPSSTAERRGSARERSGQARDAATDQGSCRPLSALAYAARCHAGQRRGSDGAPYIEHLSEVARLLRDAGCADAVIAAGLLHSVLQDTGISAAELRARFGATVSELVEATTDECVGSYTQRMHAQREQVRRARPDAALIFAANEVVEVRELADEARRERTRSDASAVRHGAGDSLERSQQMRLREHHASLAMLLAVAPRHRLVRQLAHELERCPIELRRATYTSAGR